MQINFCNKNIFILIAACVLSCQQKSNLKQIKTISSLEEMMLKIETELDEKEFNQLEKRINISKHTLSKLEKQGLDSITSELMYFEYRAYLRNVNKIFNTHATAKNLKKQILINRKQISNLKLDYQNSIERREDLDLYLNIEKEITTNTINKIKKINTQIPIIIHVFDSLNYEIETLIYE